MRNVLGWVGFVLGPVVGTAYFLFLRLVNMGRSHRLFSRGLTPNVLLRIYTRARCLPAGAITFGRTIFTRHSGLSTKLYAHELTHVEQYERLGWWRFLAEYGREQALHGYRGNRLEAEAREKAGI